MKPLSILRLVVVFLLALCSSATFASDFVTVDGFKFLVDRGCKLNCVKACS